MIRAVYLSTNLSSDRLTWYCVRLHICVSRLLVSKELVNCAGLVELYGIATGLVDVYWGADTLGDFALFSTFYFSRALGLAAFVILKLYRCTFGVQLNKEHGERCYFNAIHLIRRRASGTPDLDSKLATILTELWSSPVVFRDPQGNADSLKVRVRNRLVSTSREAESISSLTQQTDDELFF